MNDLIANPSLVVILALIAPFIVSLMKRPDWPTWAKQALAGGVAVVIGVVAVALRVEGGGTEWTGEVILGHVATVFMVAQAVYAFLLNGGSTPAAKLNARLEAVGAKPGAGP